MTAFQDNNYYHIEALIMNGYISQAIQVLIPELQREPKNPTWFLQALVAASEGCRPDILNWLAGRRKNFPSNQYLVVISRALTPGIRVEKSIKLLNQAIDLFPENAHLYYLRAKRIREMGFWHLAASEFCNVLALNPGYMIAYQLRASCYWKLGLYQWAIQDYEEIRSSMACNRGQVDKLINQCYLDERRREKLLRKFDRIQQGI